MTSKKSTNTIDPEAQTAWERTITEAERLAADREAEGWETVVILVGHTSILAREAGTTNRFGLVHTIPKADAETLATLLEAGAFPEYRIFRREFEERVFQVTELTASDRAVAVLLVSSYPGADLIHIRDPAIARGTMYTHVRSLDNEYEFTFEHDEPQLFFS